MNYILFINICDKFAEYNNYDKMCLTMYLLTLSNNVKVAFLINLAHCESELLMFKSAVCE